MQLRRFWIKKEVITMNDSMKTPYFLIHEELLEENINGFRSALDRIWPNSIFAYSVKTNSLPWILEWMDRHNIYAEVVSDEEYQLAILSGYEPRKIVFNGPIKSDYYFREALSSGSIVNIDSRHELDYLVKEKPEIIGKLGIRINIDPSIFCLNDVGYQEDGFRFGFSTENGEFDSVLRIIREIYGDIPIGIHVHVNSITRSLEVYQALAKYAAKVIIDHKMQPSYIDIGGGFFGGVPGKTTPYEYITGIRECLNDVVDISKTTLIIEPGSAAIGSVIDLHTSVIDVKDTDFGRIVTTDGSRIHIDPLWQKSRYYYTTDSQRLPHYRQVICGYTCMDHDRLMVIEDKPELMVGDHITYHRVGNYTVTFGGPFIRPFPPVYVCNNNGIEMIRKKMTIEDFFRMETV